MQILQSKKSYGCTLPAEEEDLARANVDAVFEFACRFIVMKSLPGWIEESCAEHSKSVQPVSAPSQKPGDGFPCDCVSTNLECRSVSKSRN